MWRIAAGIYVAPPISNGYSDKMSHDFKFFCDDQSIYFDLNYIQQGIFHNKEPPGDLPVDFFRTITLFRISLARCLRCCAPGLHFAPILIEEKKDGRQIRSTRDDD
jgi:hypothetical protein